MKMHHVETGRELLFVGANQVTMEMAGIAPVSNLIIRLDPSNSPHIVVPMADDEVALL